MESKVSNKQEDERCMWDLKVITEEEYDLIWQKAYNDSRGANVFNDKPSFKKALTDALVNRGCLALLTTEKTE